MNVSDPEHTKFKSSLPKPFIAIVFPIISLVDFNTVLYVVDFIDKESSDKCVFNKLPYDL